MTIKNLPLCCSGVLCCVGANSRSLISGTIVRVLFSCQDVHLGEGILYNTGIKHPAYFNERNLDFHVQKNHNKKNRD